MYFPWGRINWIKEVLSNDYKVFVIPWDLLKPVYKETERKIWETIKTGLRNQTRETGFIPLKLTH